MSFGAYQLSEKKTSVKINPKLKDLEEDFLNEGSCAGHSEGGEIVNAEMYRLRYGTQKVNQERGNSYVSQEEVSEEAIKKATKLRQT